MVLQEVDLSALAERIAQDLQSYAPDRMAHFVIEPAMIVRGDAQLLQIALENLLGNAWKLSAGRAPARIQFGRGRPEGQDAYFVRDHGEIGSAACRERVGQYV